MPVQRNSRYTPPKPRSAKTPGRDAALKNMANDLGAGNLGGSNYALGKLQGAFDRTQRIEAFDAAGGQPVARGTGPGVPGSVKLANRQRTHVTRRNKFSCAYETKIPKTELMGL